MRNRDSRFRFSYFSPPGSRIWHFLTSDSDSSWKTVYIASWTCLESWDLIKKFAGPMAHWRARSRVLVLRSCFLNPPLPPQWASGAQMCDCQNYLSTCGRSIFRSFFRFDFGLDFGLVLAPFWARLGRLLGPFLELKSGQVGPKIHLEAVFVQKSRCSRNIGKRKARATFLTPRWAQDGPKTGPRRVQER